MIKTYTINPKIKYILFPKYLTLNAKIANNALMHAEVMQAINVWMYSK